MKKEIKREWLMFFALAILAISLFFLGYSISGRATASLFSDKVFFDPTNETLYVKGKVMARDGFETGDQVYMGLYEGRIDAIISTGEELIIKGKNNKLTVTNFNSSVFETDIIPGNSNYALGTVSRPWKVINAKDFVLPSDPEFKTDIKEVEEKDYKKILDELTRIKLKKFKYKGSEEEEIGILTDEAPSELIAADGKGISLARYIALLHAALIAQQELINQTLSQAQIQATQVQAQNVSVGNAQIYFENGSIVFQLG